ncbi:MAG: choice-of-anchor J domain-containing protein [Bacteroidales bacterium]|nr:choice-of-anchor J domain-containing protein [Bacteroidales bacterium]
MKNYYNFKSLFAVVLMLIFFAATADEVRYTDSWGKTGITVKDENSTHLRLSFSIENFSMEDMDLDGESMKMLNLPGVFLPNDEGAPNLPGMSRYIAIPQGATAAFKIISSRSEVIDIISIAPAPRIPLETEDGPLHYEKNAKIYTKDAYYPQNPVMLDDQTAIRGLDVVMLGITPFQYNPVTKELIIYRDLEIEVTFSGGNGHFGEDRLRSRWFDPILYDAVLNFNSIPTMDYEKPKDPSETPDYEYLIIVPNDATFIAWADSLKKWRTLQGIRTGVVTTTEIGGNTTTAIENYINNAYNTWTIPPVAFLIIGDYGTSGSTVTSPIYNSYCVSDNIYADINGDHLPDMVHARMTAQNATHLNTMIGKILKYERTPPTNPNFYDHPISACGWQTERWFQICTSVVHGFWTNVLGKNPVRINEIYSGTPGASWSTATNTATVVNYFGPSGLGYIPSSPSTWGGWSGGTATMINNAINSGAFMMQHRDHGYEQGWGEPNYSSTSINGLTNLDLTFVFSTNCLTGKYNYSSEVFTEKFHRYTYSGNYSGAIGVNAASEVSYSFVNDAYVWGMYDNMWPNFMPGYGTTFPTNFIYPAFAQSAGKIFLANSSWPYNTSNKQVTYHLFHHHGGAFNTIYSEVPQYLTVSHDAVLMQGSTSFAVTANAGSFIALTCNGVILGTANGTGSPVNITIPVLNVGDQMIVTVTKQNYYRYASTVTVIAPNGPYLAYKSHTINDAAGNNNGMADYGENILLHLAIENSGNAAANNVNVTLSTSDTYVTITDNYQTYGTIAAGATATQNNAFAFSVDSYVPDGHVVDFSLVINGNAKDTWNGSFTIALHAPVIGIGNMTINDVAGGNGNGMLDPGETATLLIATSNTGSSASPACTGTLTSGSSYITIIQGTDNLGAIPGGGTVNASFEISVAAGTPIGTSVDLAYDAVAGVYSDSETFYKTVGLILEDWETGNMTKFEWETGGGANWTVVTESPYEGTYCAKSGAIGDNASTHLFITVNVSTAGNISFYRKVSSESGYDYLRFYIDGSEQGAWAGTVAWGQLSYSVSAGAHTFQWSYIKDANTVSGSDCAWIDYIIFPPLAPILPTAVPYSTDFDLGGSLPTGWSNSINDDFNWTPDAGGTPSSGTGPSVDHTTGTSTGYYVYTESSSPNNPGKTANLVTPLFDLGTVIDAQLSFWYHMYGAAMGSLHLDIYVNGVWTNDIMTVLSGNLGNTWFNRTVDLTPYVGEQIRLRFRGITGTSYTSDMAIDDFSITGTPAPDNIELDLKAWLQGPFNGTNMQPWLNSYGFLPTAQPYNMPPYNYTGTETANPIPNGDVVDWVLVELRETNGPAANAGSASMIGRQAGLILRDGSIVGVDGSSNMEFDLQVNYDLYVVVWHRNHLGIMSNTPLIASGNVYTYDYTNAVTKVYGGSNAHKEIAPGIWGMIAGDGDCDGQITTGDKIGVWAIESGTSGYKQGDYNMNGNVENGDKLDIWTANAGLGNQVPD